ncbi:MAG: FliA/WhiG family RNA polymerase sigma factor [Gemmatimonadales bacterium]
MTTSVTDALWQRYRSTNDADARSELLDRYLGLVHHCARDMANRVGHAVEFEDLVGAGTLGLVQALEGFDLSRGLAFSTYAMRRIRGAILDELRARDWRPRSVRAKGRQLAAVVSALQTRYGRAPDAQEVAEAMGIDLITYYRLKEDVDGGVMVSLAGTVARGGDDALRLEETLADPEGEAGIQAIGKADTLRRLREGIAQLPPRERTVLSLYYYEELNLKEIAAILHVTESRVSQIRSQAIRRLRDQSVITTDDA